MTGKRSGPRATRLGLPGWRKRPRGARRRALGRVALSGGLLWAFLAGAPLAGFAAWHWAYAAGEQAMRAEQADVRQVHAVVLQAVPGSADAPAVTRGIGYVPPGMVPVRARWTAPDGTPRTGEIPVRPGTPAGQAVSVWTNGSGQLAVPPLTRGQVANNAVLAALAAVACLGAVLTAAGRLGRRIAARGPGGQGTKGITRPRPAALPEPPRMPAAAAQPGRRATAVAPPDLRPGTGAAARGPVPASYAARWRASLKSARLADCCPGRPSVIAVMAPTRDRPHPTELLLCRHHYRAHRAALAAAGAAVYESDAVTPVHDTAGSVPAMRSRSTTPTDHRAGPEHPPLAP